MSPEGPVAGQSRAELRLLGVTACTSSAIMNAGAGRSRDAAVIKDRECDEVVAVYASLYSCLSVTRFAI